MVVGEKVSLVVDAKVISLFDEDGVSYAELDIPTNGVVPVRLAVRADRQVLSTSVIGRLARGNES